MTPFLFFSIVFIGLLLSTFLLNMLWKFIYDDPMTVQIYDSIGAFSSDDYPGFRFSSVKKNCIVVAIITVIFRICVLLTKSELLLRISIFVIACITLLFFAESANQYNRLVRRCCYDGISKKENPPSDWSLRVFNAPFLVPFIYGILLIILSVIK